MSIKYRNITTDEVEGVEDYDGEPSGLYLCHVKDKFLNYHLSFGEMGLVTAYQGNGKIGFYDAVRSKTECESLGVGPGIAFPDSFEVVRKLDEEKYDPS